ncbi:MAG: hypothetical protein OEY21_04605 [Nitrospira sp.]|nr:hypothetical protein [Nitrospira sp.]
MRRCWTIVLLLLVAGCGSSGFDRGAMRATLGLAETGAAGHTSTLAHTNIPNPPGPLRLALYFVERDIPIRQKIRQAEWMSPDKDALIKGLTPLRNEGIVADAFLLADSTIHGHDVPKIRQAAARYDADAVLIVEGVGTVDRYNNGYAAWYATLIGAYLAPGTVSDALFMISGSLWDARADRLYATQTAEGRFTLVGSAALLEDGQALAQAKKAALDEIGKWMLHEWRQSRIQPPPASDPSR